MTIPKIELVSGGRDTENVTLMCTGCDETFNYSVRQYRGDFGCNISEFEQFLQWAKWEAARHDCFLVGRIGYLPPDFFEGVERGVAAAKEGRVTLFEEDDPLAYHIDFPQVERREDPWGGVGYVVEPEDDFDRRYADKEDEDPFEFEPDCLTCGAHPWTFVDGDCPKCNPPIEDDLDAWLDNDPDYDPVDDPMDDDDWDENRFGFLSDEGVWRLKHAWETRFPAFTAWRTGRITSRYPSMQEIPRVHSFDIIYIEFDYVESEQRTVDEYLLREGVYSLDNLGCLRDEKGRCLACLRPGPHFPFYYEGDKR